MSFARGGSSPPFSTIHLKFHFYFNTFQTDFFWSTAEIREKTISEDFEVTSQVTVLVTLSKIKTTIESVPCQRPFISSASPLPAPISSVAPFHWICAITLTADKEFRVSLANKSKTRSQRAACCLHSIVQDIYAQIRSGETQMTVEEIKVVLRIELEKSFRYIKHIQLGVGA